MAIGFAFGSEKKKTNKNYSSLFIFVNLSKETPNSLT